MSFVITDTKAQVSKENLRPIYAPDPSMHYAEGSTVWPFPEVNGGARSGAGTMDRNRTHA